MYYYAVSVLPIKSITHKFLIVGHTQNEGDSVHSTIEKAIKRAKRSGPIFVPDQYAQIIRYARKRGKPYTVKEMNFNDFYDLKALTDDIGFNIGKDCDGNNIKTTELSMIRLTKDMKTLNTKLLMKKIGEQRLLLNKAGLHVDQTNMSEIELKQAYDAITFITGKLKSDLKALITSNIIPGVYGQFYEGLFELAE